MAAHAILRKDLLAGCRVIARRGRKPGERTYVTRHRDDLLLLQDAVAAEGEHLAFMRLGVPGPGAELDGLHDLVERAAPQPVVVVEVRIALGAGGAAAVAGRAIVAEHRLAT